MKKLAFNSMGFPAEPSAATKREVGTLCGAWAFLEAVSDVIMHHLYGASPDIITLLNQKMEMRSKWESIRTQAKIKLPEEQFIEVRRIATLVEKVAVDRNVVVHGEIAMIYPTESRPFWVVRKGLTLARGFLCPRRQSG